MDVLDVAYFIHQHMFYIEPCKLAFVGLSLVSLLICLFFFFVNGVFLVFVCWTAQHNLLELGSHLPSLQGMDFTMEQITSLTQPITHCHPYLSLQRARIFDW